MTLPKLDQQLGSIMEAWTTRDVAADQCRFCNERLEEPTDDPSERFCSASCADDFETVMDARIALGRRDLEQRGYD
jgi:hypothetical protein